MKEYADENLFYLQNKYKDKPTENPQYEDDDKTDGDTDNKK